MILQIIRTKLHQRSYADRAFNLLAGNAKLNPSRARLENFVRRAAESVPSGSMVLDAGAGDCRYRPAFAAHTYESADFAAVDKPYAPDLTYICDLRSVPVEDSRYDLVLLTQVMEHLPEPAAVLIELRRILKPGGALWLSAPLFFPEHEQPYDYFRYTQYGLGHLLRRAGFTVQETSWLEGYFATFGFQLSTAALQLPMARKSYGGGPLGFGGWLLTQLSRPVLLLGAALYAALDRGYHYSESGQPKNYCIVARVD